MKPIYCVSYNCVQQRRHIHKQPNNKLQQNENNKKNYCRIIIILVRGLLLLLLISLRVELYTVHVCHRIICVRLVDYALDLFVHCLTFAVCTRRLTHTQSLKDMRSTFRCCQQPQPATACFHMHDDANDDYFRFLFCFVLFLCCELPMKFVK